MREILFRGKKSINIVGKEDTGKWVIGNLVYSIGRHPMIEVWGETRSENRTYAVIPETVSQFTGLTDKNGTKIFEGDIIKWHRHHTNMYTIKIIVWDGDYAMYTTKKSLGLGHRLTKTERHDRSGETYIGDTVVLGNIHDNKELLEVNND